MRPVLVIPPEAPLVALSGPDGLQAQCRVDVDEEGASAEDGLLQAFERSAVSYLDGYSGKLGRCILKQKWALPLSDGSHAIFLPFPDCRDFSIERLDSEGNWSDVEGVSIQVGNDAAVFTDLPSDRTGLHLTCFAGWETSNDVPESLKQAVRMMVAHWFLHRETVTPMGNAQHLPMAAQALIAPLTHIFV
ncbi:head-tail connector protein [Planktotalea sp.]|uniref:head-tail connector protein n=1 Tax=Planktotalea sp. TaxID=2029877 RepID=UPI003D6BB9D8